MLSAGCILTCIGVTAAGLSVQGSADAYGAIQAASDSRYIVGPLISLLIFGALLVITFRNRSDR